MAEYINREEVIKMAQTDKAVCQCLADIVDVRDIVNCVPAADVAPVVHGHWIMNSDRPDTIICSKCYVGFDTWKHEQKYFNFCPNCGAKMDGKDGEKNDS